MTEGEASERVRDRRQPAGQARTSGSRCVNTVKLAVKQFLWCGIAENLSRQTVDAVGEEADLVSGVIGNALSLGNEPSQHTVVAFVGAFLAGRIWMGEVHLQRAVLHQRKPCKLGAVIAGNGLEHLIALFCKVGHDRLQGFVDRFGSMVASLDPNTHSRHALHQGQNAGLALIV